MKIKKMYGVNVPISCPMTSEQEVRKPGKPLRVSHQKKGRWSVSQWIHW